LQLTSVNTVAFVSSSISLFRQQRPQPSQRLSHSARVISDIAFRRQKGVCGSALSELMGPCNAVCAAREPKRDSSHILRFLKHPLRARARDAAKRSLNLCFKMNRMRLGSPKPFTTSGLILGKTDKRAIFHRNFRVHLGSSRAESRHW